MSLPLWTSDEIASYTNGKVNGSFTAGGVSIDTRTIKKGDLFIALKGDASDGHDYIAKALENGAGGILAHDGKAVLQNSPAVIVGDTFTALYDLAAGSRERIPHLKSIAVTGSVGKTGTKEMLAHVLRRFGNTHATQGNLNNHWGLPLTMVRMPQDTQYGIFEMGMNHAGEIIPLSRLAKPDVALITWIAPAHIEFFDGIEGIARAKAEIFEGMDAGGIAVLPHDNPQFPILVAEARTKGISTVLSFGSHPDSDARILRMGDTGKGNKITAEIMGETVTFTLPQFGAHHAGNAMAVLLCVKALECDLQKAAAALADFEPVSGRGNIITLPFNSGHIRIIDETYNASPEAVKAALNVLGHIESSGRRIAVLGDMLELGSKSEELHAELAETIKSLPVDEVWCCGPYMKALADALPAGKVLHFKDSKVLSESVKSLIQTDDILTIKGSHGSHMEFIVEKIKEICS